MRGRHGVRGWQSSWERSCGCLEPELAPAPLQLPSGTAFTPEAELSSVTDWAAKPRTLSIQPLVGSFR